jgi:hypothetical protein
VTSPTVERFDSWKEIAKYLERDQATVRRWEKSLGLPVRRVAGTGRSVFAYRSEIDAWLDKSPLANAEPAPPPAPPAFSRTRLGLGVIAAGALVAMIVLLVRGRSIAAHDLRVEVTTVAAIARDAAGAELWRYVFPGTAVTYPSLDPPQIIGGQNAGVYLATGYRLERGSDHAESGSLILLDTNGRHQRSFSFDDEVTFGGTSYRGPWAVQSFAVDTTQSAPRVAVAAHHYEWDPGLVTILDRDFRRQGTFVHAGWVESVRWVGPSRLLIAGFSNAHDGGMLALLDSEALSGQGPEPPGSRHHCDNCGSGGPLRMIVLPRTELNRVTGSRFNRAIVAARSDRFAVRTIEVPMSVNGDVDVLYEFSPALDLISARMGERYWEVHRALEAEGRITHTRDRCPERDGPPAPRIWDSPGGWRSLPN